MRRRSWIPLSPVGVKRKFEQAGKQKIVMLRRRPKIAVKCLANTGGKKDSPACFLPRLAASTFYRAPWLSGGGRDFWGGKIAGRFLKRRRRTKMPFGKVRKFSHASESYR
jgi:hypothetical protein